MLSEKNLEWSYLYQSFPRSVLLDNNRIHTLRNPRFKKLHRTSHGFRSVAWYSQSLRGRAWWAVSQFSVHGSQCSKEHEFGNAGLYTMASIILRCSMFAGTYVHERKMSQNVDCVYLSVIGYK